jgi:dihydrofolate reductase
MKRQSLELVAAVAANGVIGRGGQLPWHLPDDLKYFKNLTMGHPVIMGRRTFEEVKRPLPGRRNIVVSETLKAPPHLQTELAHSLDDAIKLAADSDGPVFVIGGGVLFKAAIPKADVMHLTELDESVEGDAHFPQWDRSQWKLVKEERHQRDARHATGFRFCTYRRIAS